MLKISIMALALATSAAWTVPAAAQYGWGPGYQNEPGPGHAPYGYDDSTSALGRSCAPGLYPEPFPDGNGIRCEPVGGTTEFISPRL